MLARTRFSPCSGVHQCYLTLPNPFSSNLQFPTQIRWSLGRGIFLARTLTHLLDAELPLIHKPGATLIITFIGADTAEKREKLTQQCCQSMGANLLYRFHQAMHSNRRLISNSHALVERFNR